MEAVLSEPRYAALGLMLPRLSQAMRLAKMGFSAKQIGSRLGLSQEHVNDLGVVVEESRQAPAHETQAQWRQRMADEMERNLVGIADWQSKAVQRMAEDAEEPIDKDTFGTVVDASAIAHKWLRSGEDGAKTTVTLNFSSLAQVDQTEANRGIIEIGEPEEVVELNDAPDDFLD